MSVLYQLSLKPLILLLLVLQLFGHFGQPLLSSLPQALLLIVAGLQVCWI